MVYIVLFGAVTSLRHYNFQTQAWDLGIFDQIVWNIANGNGMSTTLEFVQNHFAVHMSPILFLFAPGYLVFSSPYFLLILQTLALALGAWPLYLLAKKVLEKVVKSPLPQPPPLTKGRGEGGEVISSSGKELTNYLPLAITAAYLLYPSLHWINWFDFHPIAFLAPALLAAFYFFETKRFGWMWVFLALSAVTQEDAILIVAFFGIYLIIRELEIVWKLEIKNWKFAKPELLIGLLIFIISVLYFVFATKFLMPSYGGGLLRIDRYAQLGGGFSEIAKNLFIHPSLFISTIFQWQKFVYLFWLFLPVAFLPLFAPREWILLIPGLAQNLLTNYAPQFAGAYQYDSALIAGIFIATIYGLKNLPNLFAFLAPTSARGSGLSASLSAQSGTMPAFALKTRKKISQILIITSAISFFIRSPISPFNFPTELFQKSERAEFFQKMIERVPKNASVAAHTQIVPHLSQREKIYMLGYEPIFESDIVLIDGADYFGFPSPETFQAHIQKYADSGKYGVEILNDRYYILTRKLAP